MRICFISNYNVIGLSGGDRIFVELLKGWSAHAEMVLLGCGEAIDIARNHGARDVRFLETRPTDNFVPYGLAALVVHTCRRFVAGVRGLRTHAAALSHVDAVYSVSDFYPDLWPAFLMKRRNPRLVWIAGYYLVVPAPWAKDSPYKGGQWLRGLIYWLLQRASLFLVRRCADHVFVTSEPDVARFVTARRGREKVTVVQGGVDITESERYLSGGAVVPLSERKYDACFVGRFHYQKGVLVLLDIWRRVCDRRPVAKLAMIGDGQLAEEVRAKIAQHRLEGNVELLGFRDGAEKYEVFKQSRMMAHPATFDSGGMAAAEGMAWGLPGVSFELEALKTYYPRGMVKVPCFDEQKFADAVLRLLDDVAFYREQAAEAHALIVEVWDWHKRAENIFRRLQLTDRRSQKAEARSRNEGARDVR